MDCMNKVIQLSREFTKNIGNPHYAEYWPEMSAQLEQFDLSNIAWISIHEPWDFKTNRKTVELPHIQNNNIKGPKLEMRFWDITEDEVMKDGTPVYAPTMDDAKKIVDFILEHSDKNVLVNCAAGCSRSGAIAQFCEDTLRYEWNEYTKQFAVPNVHLLKLMNDYYTSLSPFNTDKRIVVTDKRRKYE